jgi:hypothetical protein
VAFAITFGTNSCRTFAGLLFYLFNTNEIALCRIVFELFTVITAVIALIGLIVNYQLDAQSSCAWIHLVWNVLWLVRTHAIWLGKAAQESVIRAPNWIEYMWQALPIVSKQLELQRNAPDAELRHQLLVLEAKYE